MERRTFRRRVQQPGETFDDFLVSLRELAKTCKFCSKECTDKNIRDRVIQGLLDGDTVEDLLKEKDLSLDKTIATCRAQEAAKRQRAEMVPLPGEVAAVQTPPSRPTPKSTRRTPPTTVCPGCGGSPHQGGRQNCPARGVTCYGCQKVGHFAESLTTWSYTIATRHSIQLTCENSCNGVQNAKTHLTTDKWEFAKSQVTFAGFILSEQGYQVDSSITQAIANFPTPVTRTDLRAFFGLANQLSASTATLANLLAPLRPLLSTKNEFTWSPDLEAAFSTAKQSLTTAPTVSYFDPEKPTRLCTDASRQGLGFTLQQKGGDGWTLVQAGSRFLSDTESRYAIIGLELLAVAWAITKCKLFLAGLPHFTVITDHHPLVPILNSHRLDEIENPRLQRLRNRIISYNLTAQWIKGTMNNGPAALSRHPLSDPAPHEQLAEFDQQGNPEPSIAAMRVTAMDQSVSLRLEDLRKLAETDQEYQQLQHFVHTGFPEHRHQSNAAPTGTPAPTSP